MSREGLEPYQQTIQKAYTEIFGAPAPEQYDRAIWQIFTCVDKVPLLPAALQRDLLEIALEGPVVYGHPALEAFVKDRARGLWPGSYPAASGP